MRNLLSTFKKMVICMLPLFVVACHVSPAWAKDNCTAKLSQEYQQEVVRVVTSSIPASAKRIAQEAIDWEFEQKWMECKMKENRDE